MEPLASTGELEAPSTAGDWRPVWTPRLDMVPFVPQEAFVTPVLVEPGLHLPSGHHMDNNNMAMEDVSVAAASLQDSALVEVKGDMARPWERPHLWPILP